MALPKIEDSRRLSDEELAKEIIAAKKKLFQLRFAKATNNLKKTHLIKHTKHRIAQLLTVERERQIAVAKIQGKKPRPHKLAVKNRHSDSKIDANLLYAFDLLNRGLEPEVKVVTTKKGTPLIDLLVQLYEPSWKAENIPDYHEDFRFGNIVGCLGSLDTVNTLKQDAAVKFIEASKPAGVAEGRSCKVISYKDDNHKRTYSPASLINAEVVHQQEQGDKVIVALIDDGIDIFHDAFFTIDPTTNAPKTRILAIWDQTDINNSIENPSNRISPGVCSGGREYTQQDIQKYLNAGMNASTATLPVALTNGQGGHGTMVASIAAGSRGQSFPGGIAPEAEIVLVKANSRSFVSSHIKGIKYIKYLAERENLPVVVNISQGINAGAHDGISILENAYEYFLGDKSVNFERSVVKSAGNERLSRLHASIDVISNNNLSWDSSPTPRTQDLIQLWFSSVNLFKFRLKHINGILNQEEITEWVTLDTNFFVSEKFFFSSGNECKISYWKHKNDEDNADSCVEIAINKGTSSSIMTGHWKLEIKRMINTNKEGLIHAWIEIGTRAIQFKHHDKETVTLTLPGTAKHIITVGSAVRDEEDGSFDSAETSSFGPTRDQRDSKTKKPCVAAPGENVCAAYSGMSNAICQASGTSMAAPHIAGAIALVLSARAKRNQEQILTAAEIQDEIRQATIEASEWNEGLGFGVVDVNKLFKALV